MLFCASSSPAAKLFWMSCSCICAPTPRASSCTVAVVSYFCRFSRILRTTALPPMAIYIKSSPSRQSKCSGPPAVADDEAAPVLSAHRTLLGGELASRENDSCPALLPQRLNAHQSGENQGSGLGGWRRVEPFWVLFDRGIEISRSAIHNFLLVHHVLEYHDLACPDNYHG